LRLREEVIPALYSNLNVKSRQRSAYDTNDELAAKYHDICGKSPQGGGKVEDLDEHAGFVSEEKDRAARPIKAELIANQCRERDEAFAHVAGLQRDIDLEIAIEGFAEFFKSVQSFGG